MSYQDQLERIRRLRLQQPETVLFGWGARSQIAEEAPRLGRTALVVCGSRTLQSTAEYREICDSLDQAGIAVHLLAVQSQEPLVSDVDRIMDQLRHDWCGLEAPFLLAIGGGSGIDLAKAIAALATNSRSESVVEFLEGVGSGLEIQSPPLPVIAIPTTAGTGSEATRNAVISSDDPTFKKSLRSDLMVPTTVIIDPQLTCGCSTKVTAYAGMDAVVQLIESYLSRRASEETREVVQIGMPGVLSALEQCVANPLDQAARTTMAWAAFCSGVALANSGLGMAHGVAAALGVHCHIPHGLACAVMLPATLTANRVVSKARLADLAEPLGLGSSGTADHRAERVIAAVNATAQRVGIPTRLRELGVHRDQIPAIVRSSRGNSMNGNPKPMTDDELVAILESIV